MYSCKAYGLRLQCNLLIPGLSRLTDGQIVDVRVTLGAIPFELVTARFACAATYFVSSDLDESGRPALEVYPLEGGRFFQVEYADKTIFVVDAEGSRVWATWPESATLEDTATYLLGPILGFVLRLRGVTCLHASAVVIEDRALAFVGPSGAGKSSIAAAFAQRGHAVFSDDVVALSDLGDSFLVQPAYPRVRLWPESVEGLFGAADALSRLTPSWDKRFLQLSGRFRFQSTSLPLAAIYVLGERRASGTAVSIGPISQRTALIELVSNSYTSYLLNPRQRAQEFELLGRLLDHVPLHVLKAGANLRNFDPTYDAIIEHFLKLDVGSDHAAQTHKAYAS